MSSTPSSTPYLSLTNQDNEYVYKKTLGVSDKLPGSSPDQEPLFSSPYVYNSQIMSNSIPSKAPTTLNSATYINGGGYKYDTIGNNYIFKYEYLPLKTIGYVNNNYIFSYTYKNYDTDPNNNSSDPSYNFAMRSISSKYDPVNASYAITVYAKKYGVNTYQPVPSSSDIAPWIFDNTTGYITFTKQAWNSVYNNNTGFDDFPYISFYRYEGPFGVNGGDGSTQWTTSGSNIYYNTGNVGIGTTDPQYKLDVSGNTNITESTYLATTSGNVGIGTSTPNSNYKLDVSGNTNITGNLSVTSNLSVTGSITTTSITTTSDYRLKKDIKNIDESFTIDNLNPVIYKLINNDETQTGFIAHEVQEYYPFLVNGKKDGESIQSINYSGLIPILVNEIQNLKKEVSNIKDELLKYQK